jgi:hypothetical protein
MAKWLCPQGKRPCIVFGLDFVSFIPMKKDVEVIAIRLQPGEDLKQSLLAYCIHQKIEAAYMLSCVGSLRRAAIRFANKPEEVERPNYRRCCVGPRSSRDSHGHKYWSSLDTYGSSSPRPPSATLQGGITYFGIIKGRYWGLTRSGNRIAPCKVALLTSEVDPRAGP